MADITASCFVKGGRQDAVKPFSWHVWDIDIPIGVHTAAGTEDTILLPDRFKADVRCLAVTTQVYTAGANAGAYAFDVTTALRAIDGGTISGAAALESSIDLLTTGTTYGTATAPMVTFGTGVTAGTDERVVRIDVTPTTGLPTTKPRFLVGLLLGRITM